MTDDERALRGVVTAALAAALLATARSHLGGCLMGR